MKQRNAPTRLICCLSVFGLSLAACSQKATNVKPAVPPRVETQPSTTIAEGSTSRLFHYSQKGLRQVKIKDTRSTKRVQYEYANLWERLFDNYALPDVRNLSVERELTWFVNHPSYLQRAQQRAEPFLYNIVQQIERQGVPGELALLPVVESAFQAQAVSPAKAAGIWQFIPATGRHYGLRQNHAYDGRRDVYASTRAAIKYLKKLNRQFNGDWLLAIAAYNCGEGAVERAIQRNMYNGLPADFWSLDLPQETRAYVPRLLAVSRLMADADHYGVDLLHIPNKAQYKPIKVNQQLDLALAADAADMSLEQFKALNPGFKNTFVDPEGSVRLFVPASKSKTFKKELARLANVQTDLLRQEFDRRRESTEDGLPARSADTSLATLNETSRPQTSVVTTSDEWRRNTPTDPASVPVAPPPGQSASNTLAATEIPSATSYGTRAGYASSGSAEPTNPFLTNRAAEEFTFDEELLDEPRQRPSRKGHYQSLSSRSPASRHSIRASEVKKNTRGAATSQLEKSERGAARRTGKPAVSYRYSGEPATSKAAIKQTARLGAGSTDRKAERKAGKQSAAASTATPKIKYRDAGTVASASGRGTRNGKNGVDVRKSERIVTAKAEVAKVKSRR